MGLCVYVYVCLWRGTKEQQYHLFVATAAAAATAACCLLLVMAVGAIRWCCLLVLSAGADGDGAAVSPVLASGLASSPSC